MTAVSLVLESANVQRAGLAYFGALLDWLDRHEHPGLAEVLLVDDGHSDSALLRQLVDDHLARTRARGVATRIIEVPGAHYYELKVAGARDATGDVLVFLDSDVVPARPDLLERLLRPLDLDGVVATTVATAVGPPVDLWSRAFHLWWNFRLPDPDGGLVEVGNYFANGFAMRAQDFAANPLAARSTTHRHECVAHGARLRAAGHRILRDDANLVWHQAPPRDSWIERAVEHGEDRHFRRRFDGRPERPAVATVVRQFVADMLRVARRTRQGRKGAGLPWWQVPATTALAVAYFTVVGWAQFRSMRRGDRWDPEAMQGSGPA